MKPNMHHFIIVFLAGIALGAVVTNYPMQKGLAEIEIMGKTIELSNGLISYTYHKMLVEGKVEDVKESLYEEYEKAKREANSINVEELAASNWPFTVDDWYIKHLRREIKILNDPDSCNRVVASMASGAEIDCGGY